jgi:hypothetical protein
MPGVCTPERYLNVSVECVSPGGPVIELDVGGVVYSIVEGGSPDNDYVDQCLKFITAYSKMKTVVHISKPFSRDLLQVVNRSMSQT